MTADGHLMSSDATADFASPPPTPPPHTLLLPDPPTQPRHQKPTRYGNDKDRTESITMNPESRHVEQPPSKSALMWGHLKHLVIAFMRFTFKNNNLVLMIHLVHHLWSARTLLRRPIKVVSRMLQHQQHSAVWTGHQSQQLVRDVLRAVGVMHLAFAMLTGLALKERRLSTERSALLVLTMASVGQAWAHVKASGAWWAGRWALRDTGALDAIMFIISSVAFSRTIRR